MPNGLSVFALAVEGLDWDFKINDSGLFIKYNTKNKKSSKKLLTDSFYSGILTKLSQGIVSSE